MNVIHEQKEDGQMEKLSQPVTEDIYKKRMDVFLNKHRFPPAQKIVTRKLASEALFAGQKLGYKIVTERRRRRRRRRGGKRFLN